MKPIMNHYEKVYNIKKLTDAIGTIYGTEDFSIYLYSLIKMKKPKTIVELGTGVGSVMLWSALALEENSFGTIYTVDDGSDWNNLNPAVDRFTSYYDKNYIKYIENLIKVFEFTQQINFINKKIETVDVNEIDILFSDFSHSVFNIIKLLSEYLPKMSEDSVIFIDSASTLYSSFKTLEDITNEFNNGRVPRIILEMAKDPKKIISIVKSSKFSLSHLIENKDRTQNSTAMLQITPIDIFPYPRVNMRF
jgi:predicted O-methyltransferase YrrM